MFGRNRVASRGSAPDHRDDRAGQAVASADAPTIDSDYRPSQGVYEEQAGCTVIPEWALSMMSTGAREKLSNKHAM